MKKNGFTLIELLMVIIIVGVLAAVSIPMVNANIEKARWTEAVTTLGMLRRACRVYYVQTGGYHTGLHYLNGSNKSSSIPPGLDLNIDDPDSEGRYIYRLDTYVSGTYGRRLAYGFRDSNGDDAYASGDPYIGIYADGTLLSISGAPDF